MDFKISHESPSEENYVSLRIRSGMGAKDLRRSAIALKNSLYITAIYDKKQANSIRS